MIKVFLSEIITPSGSDILAKLTRINREWATHYYTLIRKIESKTTVGNWLSVYARVGEFRKAVLIISYRGLGYQAGRHLDIKLFESGGEGVHMKDGNYAPLIKKDNS